VASVAPDTPSITSPATGSIFVSRSPTLLSSLFVTQSTLEDVAHASSSWEIYDSADLGPTDLVWKKYLDATNKRSIVVNSTNGTFQNALAGQTSLLTSTQYWARSCYTDTEDITSHYSAVVPFTTIPASTILGTREEILASLFSDLSSIQIVNGFSLDVGLVIRQFEGFNGWNTTTIAIDSAAESKVTPLLKDLHHESMTIIVVGATFSEEWTNDTTPQRVISTQGEAFVKAMKDAVMRNPFRTINGQEKALHTYILRTDANINPPMAAYVLTVLVEFTATNRSS
jgi:hypothetical protein